jgi:hypothetical protein
MCAYSAQASRVPESLTRVPGGNRAAEETACHGAEASPDVGNDAVEIAIGRDSSKRAALFAATHVTLPFLMP